MFDVTEKSISELLEVLQSGEVTSVDLVCAYLNRIGFFDRSGISLNAVPILNPDVLAEARASDEWRLSGEKPRPLEGIPFTVKDSYKVKGLTVASGSPAFADLIANADASSVKLLREAGAVLLGKTNMPPMAAGGVQPGLYGFAKSPYHPGYLTAAFGSGSSNGSATAVAASFCAFSMAEETLSSGRSPASNNALVAYTPSRGLISISGNWPLFPTCDVVVPYTRSTDDLARVLDVLVTDVENNEGDFWREQNVVSLPRSGDVRPASFSEVRRESLSGLRIGVPKMFVGDDPEKRNPVALRESVRWLWQRAEADLRDLGADVVRVDLPLVSNYEKDRVGALNLLDRNLVSPEWMRAEMDIVIAASWNDFLVANGDSWYPSLADVDGDNVFPDQPSHVYANAATAFDYPRLIELAKVGLPALNEIPGYEQSLLGLERARKVDLEDWMLENRLDAVAFPAAGDVAKSDLFENRDSMEEALRNGVLFSNGNRAIRHLGVPTVSVSMGAMPDISMPVNITFAGAAYDDASLIGIAAAYESATRHRPIPPLTPHIPSSNISAHGVKKNVSDHAFDLELLEARRTDVGVNLCAILATTGGISDEPEIQVWFDGRRARLKKIAVDRWEARLSISHRCERVGGSVLAVIKAQGAGISPFAHVAEVQISRV